MSQRDHDGRRAPTSPPVIPARQLFADGPEVRIEYRGEVYRLRITRNEKLILTK